MLAVLFELQQETDEKLFITVLLVMSKILERSSVRANCFLYADSLLIKFAFLFYVMYVQYDESEDALWLDEESEDMGYLEMLNVRFVCQ